MSFLHPEFLYYMLPPLIILFIFLLTQKESQAHFFSEEVMNKLRVGSKVLTLRARNALLLLVGLFMIIALAEPVITEGTVTLKAKSADIMIALDISDSMLATDVYPNRIEVAKQKALELLKIAPNERIGVIAFAKNSYLVSPLSFDHSAVSFLLSQLNTESITQKGTNFLSLLNVVEKSLDKQSKKYLLILSDGGDSYDFSQEIEIAKKSDIVVFVLGVGTDKGAPVKLKNGSFITQDSKIIVSKLNENISKLATKSGGVYIQNSTSSDDIKAMLSEIESVSVEKELKSEEVNKYTPLFYYPLAISLFFLLIATSSMHKRNKATIAPLFILFSLLFINPELKAGVLDFIDLNEAKEAYENKDYEKASKLYLEHANKTQNGQSYYNAGNSLYKQKKYAQAVESYQKAVFDDEQSRAQNFSNMGNAYAKQANEESFKKAVEFYEKSLEIKEDKQTRENLEEVKKALKKDEQESKDKKDKDSKEDDKKEKDKKDKDSNDDKKSDDDKEDQSSDKEKSDKDKSKDEKSEKEKSEDEKKESDEKKSKDESQKESKNDNNQTKDEKKPPLEQISKDEDNKSSSQSSSQQQQLQADKMSDAEEAKWLDQLNLEQNTYMYMLDDKKTKEENEYEKPW